MPSKYIPAEERQAAARAARADKVRDDIVSAVLANLPADQSAVIAARLLNAAPASLALAAFLAALDDDTAEALTVELAGCADDSAAFAANGPH